MSSSNKIDLRQVTENILNSMSKEFLADAVKQLVEEFVQPSTGRAGTFIVFSLSSDRGSLHANGVCSQFSREEERDQCLKLVRGRLTDMVTDLVTRKIRSTLEEEREAILHQLNLWGDGLTPSLDKYQSVREIGDSLRRLRQRVRDGQHLRAYWEWRADQEKLKSIAFGAGEAASAADIVKLLEYITDSSATALEVRSKTLETLAVVRTALRKRERSRKEPSLADPADPAKATAESAERPAFLLDNGLEVSLSKDDHGFTVLNIPGVDPVHLLSVWHYLQRPDSGPYRSVFLPRLGEDGVGVVAGWVLQRKEELEKEFKIYDVLYPKCYNAHHAGTDMEYRIYGSGDVWWCPKCGVEVKNKARS